MTPHAAQAAPHAGGSPISMLTLHTYFRSSASYRVRIALGLKGLSWRAVPVHLVRNGGEQHRADFLALNPSGLVPVLRDGEVTVTQSLAIIEYLEELQPEPNLVGRTPAERARVRSLSLDIACEIHPLNNLRVLGYLTGELGLDEARKLAWYRHWVETGLQAFERRLSPDDAFCAGDRPTMADCCLVPQVFNARRFGADLSAVPKVAAIAERCAEIEAFRAAEPGVQADAA
ncbi:MAG: hypothetical protein RIS35_1873 [Pseudomonadota bacterium]